MATTKKMTKATAFAIALEVLEASNHPEKDIVMEKIQTEIANLAKKSSSSSGALTKAQQANAVLAEQVAEFMAEQPTRLFSIGELSKECPAVMGATPQKIRPLLTSLIKENKVARTEEKGKPMFQFVACED